MGRHKKIVSNGRMVHFTNQNGITQMNITKVVEKQVTNPLTGLKVARKANITFTVPDYTVSETTVDDKKVKTVVGLSMANAIATFGSSEKLIQFAIAGLWNVIRTNESNELGKADKASRQLSKAAKALKAVMPTLTDETLRAMLMSNPEYAKTFETQEFSLEVSKTIDLNTVKAPVLDETADEDDAEVEETESDAPAK